MDLERKADFFHVDMKKKAFRLGQIFLKHLFNLIKNAKIIVFPYNSYT